MTNCPNEILVGNSIKMILNSMHIPPNHPEFKRTPMRVASAWTEMMRGYKPPDFELTTFPTTYKGMVVRKGIPFISLCAHHIIPYSGTVDFGYIPNGNKLGISKIIRFVQWKSAVLSSQEELTQELCEDFNKMVKPKGVMVVMSALHGCEACRGVKVGNVPTITSWFMGVFKDKEPREEFMFLIQKE
jgi:GTP cyclohydrolase I